MTKVTIYTKSTCPYCHSAMELLRAKGIVFNQIAVDGDSAAQKLMQQRANGRHTVPQIFIDDRHIGGCDDLHALAKSGELDKLLSA